MIAPASGPVSATQEGLHALYVSLNSPVVAMDPLPVGPATAAIAVHGEGTTLVIRSSRTGTLAYFAADSRFGLESALSHAEGLGFLFDDEANLAGSSVARGSWPVWLAEVFAAEAEQEAGDPAAWLSKFRWLLRRPTDRSSDSAPRTRAARSGDHGHP
jgi:hypothetical protein